MPSSAAHAPRLEAVVFDLDGVITRTAQIHFAAWKRVFDELLARLPAGGPGDARPFSVEDYREHVDGKPRGDGIRDFLASRGIAFADDEAAGDSALPSVRALGDRKNACFLELVERDGVPVDPAAVALVRALKAEEVRVGVATSSRNATTLLARGGLAGLFDAQVDGETSAALGLRGKPAPDIFLECLRRLGAPPPAHAVVVEDATSGVAAGRAGRFGLVLGVDRGGNGARLAEAGAQWVVRDLREVTAAGLRVRLARAAAHRAGDPMTQGGDA